MYKSIALPRPRQPAPLGRGRKARTMRNSSGRRVERAQAAALLISLAWMVLAQVGCVMCWEAGFLTRQASLLHWLVVGVLPPALALWGMETERTRA